MSDARGRELERAAASGGPHDEARALLERLRLDPQSRWRSPRADGGVVMLRRIVELDALWGGDVARMATREVPRLPWSYLVMATHDAAPWPGGMCLALAVFRAARRFWAEFNDPLRVREWPGELWRAEDECASLLERDAEPYRRDEPSNRRRPTLAAEALELGERDEHARRTAFGLRLVYEGSRSGRRMAVALRSACVRALIASDSLQREDDITNRRQARAWHTLAALWPGETTGPMRGPEMTPGEWAFQAAFEREWLELPTDDASQRRRACEVLEDIARLASREMRDILDALDIYSDEPRARATVGAGWSGLRRDWVNRLPARLTEPRGW